MKNADMPAMPIEFSGFGPYAPEAYAGLNKREMFAMHAMQALATNTGYGTWEDMANDAVNISDALLAELERTK